MLTQESFSAFESCIFNKFQLESPQSTQQPALLFALSACIACTTAFIVYTVGVQCLHDFEHCLHSCLQYVLNNTVFRVSFQYFVKPLKVVMQPDDFNKIFFGLEVVLSVKNLFQTL
jgi:hypothetical protein